jgi:SAM-dependent methyltransferase
LQKHFDALFESGSDPWGYASVWEEQRRHTLLLTMLDAPHFRSAFEPACATGLLTKRLAERTGELLAWDSSAVAVSLARDQLSACHNVTVAAASVPEQWPTATFDLIVLSDFLYYLSPIDIGLIAAHAEATLSAGGLVIACHWRGIAHDFLTPGGDEVHRHLRDAFGDPVACCYSDQRQLIDGWRR